MVIEYKYTTHGEAETRALAFKFAKSLEENQIVCLFGDLGAGKTTFVKGMHEALSGSADLVSSPTFSLLNIYQGDKVLYHFDLYRLHDADEFLAMGFDEYFFADGICCIEWSERITRLLPLDSIFLTLAHAGGNMRHITITNHDKISL